MSKKKICLVIPTLVMGGAERVMSELANAWALSEYEVNIILLSRQPRFYQVNERIVVHEIDVRSTGFFNRKLREIILLIRLWRLFKELNPLFILSFMTRFNIFVLLASRRLSIPTFVSDRSSPYVKFPSLIESFRRLMYPTATGIVAQTSEAYDELISSYKVKNVRVIPNPQREIRSEPDRKRKKIILNVGRLIEEKGQEYLIRAFAESKLSGWRLVILGDGPLMDNLMNLVRELDLTNSVEMPGSVSDIDSYLNESSMFAFTSISEGYPNALSEALTAGLPCISFDCPVGPKDLIHNGENGVLIKMKDVDALVEAMKQLANDLPERERLGVSARKSAQGRMVNIVAQQYLDFCLGN